MAWQMPPAGQWPAAMAMPQNLSMNMNMGSYTPEQWTAMQQQNWQQWNQWQQQYSQWQQQYGEKYAQHMQAAMPPLPAGTAPPPAPPPPEQPPPPPPHENNQPLYGNTPANKTNSNFSNIDHVTNQRPPYNNEKANQQLSSANIEALNKLAQEEKLFDIQFQKWEEEIEKWRRDNVDHPDKQAYKEYEQKFEACRKQLLERRQQMKANRALLLQNVSQDDNKNNTALGNVPTPASHQSSNNSSKPITQAQNYNNNMQSFQPQYSQPASLNRGSNKNIDPQDRYESYQEIDNGQNIRNVNIPINIRGPVEKSDPAAFLTTTSSSSKPIPGLDLVPDIINSSNIQEVIDITDDQNNVANNMKVNMHQGPDYSTISKGINYILGDEKIMNILSMVQGQNVLQPQTQHNIHMKAQSSYPGNNQNYPLNQDNWNANNINQDQQYGNRQNMHYNRQGPNMPMQQNRGLNGPYNQQQETYNDGPNMQQGDYFNRNAPFGDLKNRGPDMRPAEFDSRDGGNMKPGGVDSMRPGFKGMRQGGSDLRHGDPDMRQVGLGMRQGGPDFRQGGPDMRPAGPSFRQGGPGLRQGGPDLRQGGTNMAQGGPDMRQGGPDIRQSGLDMRQQGGPDMRQGGTDMRPGGPNMRQGAPDMRRGGPDVRQGGPSDMGGPNMGPQAMKGSGANNQTMQPSYNNGSIPPLMSLNSRPPLQDMSAKQNVNNYYGSESNNVPIVNPPQPKWVEEPLFAPSLVVEYDHKPLRLKARDFIEPVHTFDYNHKSKDEDLHKNRDFEKEADQIFVRKPRRSEDDVKYVRDDVKYVRDDVKYVRDPYHRDYNRREIRPRDDVRDTRDIYRDGEIRDVYRDTRDDSRDRVREKPRDDFDRWRSSDRLIERRREDVSRDFRRDERLEDRREDRRDDRRDDRDRGRRDSYSRERDRDNRDRRDDIFRDIRRDETRENSKSRDSDSRKRALSKESEVSSTSKKSKGIAEVDGKKHVVMIDDILEPPGRDMRPDKIAIILRGIPGSGKSYLAKLIRDREAEHGGTVRIMSIDDYFMQEGESEEKDPQTGKMVRKPYLKYEYDEVSEETYMNSLKRAFKRSLTDGYFSFLIYDAVNDQLKHYADIWNFARQNGFQVYVCTMDGTDVQACYKRNIHNRKLEDIQIINARFFETPSHHIRLDATTLLQSASITEVQMEDVEDDVVMEDVQDEVESVFTSKWEKMDDAVQLARLDGTSKPLRPSQYSMENYLQLDDWIPNTAKPGKKTVRWADIEERREQEKMRAIGFVVGQTDWNRMTDPTMGSSALTQTKYIERVRRY